MTANEFDRPGTRLYTIWKGMKRRCQSPGAADFSNYGGRGITVCAEWQTFVGFLDWALISGYSQHKDLDRIDNEGPYDSDNCRWIARAVNTARQEFRRSAEPMIVQEGALSQDQVDSAGVEDHPYKLWDGTGTGLHLTVSTTGAKSWRVKFTIDGREQLLTLGRSPALSLTEARELATVARSQLRRGVNPSTIKKQTAARRARRQRARI